MAEVQSNHLSAMLAAASVADASRVLELERFALALCLISRNGRVQQDVDDQLL